MRDYFFTTLPATHCQRSAVELIARAAAVARFCGMHDLSRRLAAWAYDVCDCGPTSDAWDRHREILPWAWSDRRSLLAWWSLRS
jgi:hypothetical protein